MGDNIIDFAAGVPLHQRQSRPEIHLPEREDYEEHEEKSGLFPSGHWGRDETPIVLPVSKSWITIVTVISLALIPIAIWLLMAIASKNSTSEPGDYPSRTEVGAPRAQSVPAEPSPAATQAAPPAPEATATVPRVEPRASTSTKRKTSASPAKPFEVKKRAAPQGRSKSP